MMDAFIIEMMKKDKAPYPCQKKEEIMEKKKEEMARVCVICKEYKGDDYPKEYIYGCKKDGKEDFCVSSDEQGYVSICRHYNGCHLRQKKPINATYGYCEDCLERRQKQGYANL